MDDIRARRRRRRAHCPQAAITRYRPATDRKLARSVDRLGTRANSKLEHLGNTKATKLLAMLGLKI